jgi:hypothetical protein
VKLRGKINAYKDFPVDNPTNIKLEDEEKEEPEIDKEISREFAEGKFDEEIHEENPMQAPGVFQENRY